jgi:hypothetical protein
MIAFDEYLKLFMKTQKTEELVIGAWHRGHSRAVYEFRGQVVYCDSTCSYSARSVEALRGLPPLARTLLLLKQEPRDTWWTDYCMAGKQRSERIAQGFGGCVTEAPYGPEDSWCFVYAEVEKIVGFMYARESGELTRTPTSVADRRKGD